MINFRQPDKPYKYEEEKKNAETNLKLAIARCIDVGLSAKQIALIVVKMLRKG